MLSCCDGNNIYGNEPESGSGGSGGGSSPATDHIISPDATASVTCINGGIIQSIGNVNFQEHSLNRVTTLNAGTTVPFHITKDNVDVEMDTDLFSVTNAGQNRVSLNSIETDILSPTGSSLVILQDGFSIIGGPGGFLYTDALETRMQHGTDKVSLPGGGVIDMVSGGNTSGTFDSTGLITQHAQIYDQGAFGNHNPLFVSGDGLTYMYIENRALADASAPYGFIGVGNNFIFGRANRSGGLPLPINAGGMVIDVNGFVGVNSILPTSQFQVTGPAGQAFRFVDGQEAPGRVLVCIDSIGNVKWTQPARGYIYHEDAVNVGTTVVIGALNTQVLVNVPTTLNLSSDFDMPANGRLRYTGAITTVFRALIDISMSNLVGEAELKDIVLWPYKNGVAVPGASTRTITILEDWVSASCEFLVSLATNDYIELYLSNESPMIVTTADVRVGTMQILLT